MLTSTGRSLGILLLALVSKVLRHKNRHAAQGVSVSVPAHSERGGGEGEVQFQPELLLAHSQCTCANRYTS